MTGTGLGSLRWPRLVPGRPGPPAIRSFTILSAQGRSLSPLAERGRSPARPGTGGEVGAAPAKLARVDKAALTIIGLSFLFLLAAWGKQVPAMSDTWYHLALADRFIEQRGIPLWVDWEFAPAGRPNMYPPLLHMILASIGVATGSVITAGRVLAVTFYPLSLLSCWYCARRLLGSGPAFIAVLIALLDISNVIVMQAYIASCLTNILAPLLLVAIAERRAWVGIPLMTALYYSHLGFPHVVALGLLLFGLLDRSYLRLILKIVGISFLFWIPWLAHALGNIEWVARVLLGGGLPMPLIVKLLSLQFLNPVIIVPGLIGAVMLWRAGGEARLLPCMMLGFLPILLSYGGRYMMHSLPAWAMCGAWAVRGLVPDTVPRVRLALLGLATVLPTPAFGFFGKPAPLPFTGAMLVAAMPFTGGLLGDGGEKSERYGPDCDQLAAWLRSNTTPDEIIHTNKEWVADSIALLAHRRTDFGAWWECGTDAMKREIKAYRDEQLTATYVVINPRNDSGSILRPTESLPGVDETFELGRFLIGLRNRHTFEPDAGEVPLGSFRPVALAGLPGDTSVEGRRLVWHVPKAPVRLAAIEAPLDTDEFDGIRATLRSDQPGPLVLGFVDSRGIERRAEVMLPDANATRTVTVPVAWMTTVRGETDAGLPGPRLYIAWAADGDLSERRTEVGHVRLLQERLDSR